MMIKMILKISSGFFHQKRKNNEYGVWLFEHIDNVNWSPSLVSSPMITGVWLFAHIENAIVVVFTNDKIIPLIFKLLTNCFSDG